MTLPVRFENCERVNWLRYNGMVQCRLIARADRMPFLKEMSKWDSIPNTVKPLPFSIYPRLMSESKLQYLSHFMQLCVDNDLSIKILSLVGCKNINHESVTSLFRFIPEIEKVAFNHTPLNLQTIRILADCLKMKRMKLRYISFIMCNMNDDMVRCLVPHLLYIPQVFLCQDILHMPYHKPDITMSSMTLLANTASKMEVEDILLETLWVDEEVVPRVKKLFEKFPSIRIRHSDRNRWHRHFFSINPLV